MTPEHILMNQIRLWCGEHDILAFRANVGTHRRDDGRWFSTGLPKGFPDLFLLLPNSKTVFVECKIPPRKPTQEQLDFLKTVNEKGFPGFVVYSLQQFITLILPLL